MARPLRIELAGGLYHVMCHGNERREVFRDDDDRQRRLDWLQCTVETCGWRLHAFPRAGEAREESRRVEVEQLRGMMRSAAPQPPIWRGDNMDTHRRRGDSR